MFACFYSLSASQTVLVAVAQDYSPRFEIVGPLVMIDLDGLTRLFGTPRDIGEQMRRSFGGAPVRIAIAASQTAAALLALGRPGLTVVSGDDQSAAVAALPVSLLGELETFRHGDKLAAPPLNGPHRRREARVADAFAARHIGGMEDVLPYFQSRLDQTAGAAAAAFTRKPLDEGQGERRSTPPAGAADVQTGAAAGAPTQCGGGWQHPRDSHAARLTKRMRRELTAPKEQEHPHSATGTQRAALVSPKRPKRCDGGKDIAALLDVLRRWGVKTLGALAALPAGDVYERLGARGVAWQRLARGDDHAPLVPCVPDDPFEGAVELEWPIEGLEPLSFVLARVFEPLAEQLERADRGAAILHTHLRLTTREVYARSVQLPAPMRDPKTLRTLVLLDLEANPPSAAIDGVRVLVEPTQAKVLQWTLYERAQPSPEHVSTLVARLTALMGEGHVGSAMLLDSWKPGVFAMTPFTADTPATSTSTPASAAAGTAGGAVTSSPAVPAMVLRRFRLPIPARVQMADGRPVRVTVDRRGIGGGAVAQSAGPWRTSGEWWNDQPAQSWDRDEWDVHLDGGAAYRIFVERTVGQWFIEGVLD